MGINVTNLAAGARHAFVDGETMIGSTPGVPDELVSLLREIEVVAAYLEMLEQQATELTARDVDGGNVVYLAPASASGWGKRRELGR